MAQERELARVIAARSTLAPAAPTPGFSQVTSLTDEEVAFFVEHGYLIKKSFMDPALCAAARDVLWAGNRSSRLKRGEPETWHGPFDKADENDDEPGMRFVNGRTGNRWHLGSCGGEQAIMDALPRAVLPLIEQLLGAGSVALPAPAGELPQLGERVWMPKWSRGIYCTLPGSPPRPPGANGCHTDSHPLHIGAVGYIDDVLPNGGGIRVWDRSHRVFYPTFEFQYSQRRPEGRWSGQWTKELGSDQYKVALEAVRSAEPVDAHGPVGTVVFWHGRVGHDAGPNYQPVGGKIRQAILYDFSREDMDAMDTNPPSQSMWRDWSPQVQAIAARNGHDAIPIDGPLYKRTDKAGGPSTQLLLRALEKGGKPQQKL